MISVSRSVGHLLPHSCADADGRFPDLACRRPMVRTDIAVSGWMSASLGNNFATPTLLDALGSPLALNVLEQASMAAIALIVLHWRKSPALDFSALRRAPLTIAGIGLSNALTCRLFMVSLHELPLSLCHTIRSLLPCVAALIGLASGHQFAAHELLALPVLAAGFALAVSAQPSCSVTGVAAALGSLLALSALQHLSKRVLDLPERQDQ